MQNENEEIIDSTNDSDETVELDVDLAEQEDDTENEVLTLRKQIETLEHQKRHWKEKATQPVKEVVNTDKKQDLSTKDLLALMNAKISEDDIEDVLEYASFKKIPVSEALKSSVVKATLNDKAEERRLSVATSSGAQRRSTHKVSDEAIYANAKKGEVPETDEGYAALWRARKGLK